jgi:glycosyltransferase involved in cell wall biosynthesis
MKDSYRKDLEVSIIIPCRNEEFFIENCLNSIINQSYPKTKMEILVVDGMSTDKTRKLVRRYIEKYKYIKLINNPKKITSSAFNKGIKKSKGKYIVFIGAHAKYPKKYIVRCIKTIKTNKADNVGGILKIKPKKDTLIAKTITYVLSSFLGSGNSFFKNQNLKKVKEVDTVFGGCYKREIFDRIGLFNEELKRSQDIELNLRLKKAGGKIMLNPNIVAYYYPKSDLYNFFRHNFDDGFWAIFPFKFIKSPLKLRHYMPLLFVLTLPFNLLVYFPLSLLFGFKFFLKEKDMRIILITPIVFFIRHFAYGLGSLWALVKLFFNYAKKENQRN